MVRPITGCSFLARRLESRILLASAALGLAALTSGCTITHDLNVPPFSDYPTAEKFDMRVRLDLLPEFRNYVYSHKINLGIDTFAVPLGETLTNNAVVFADTLFRDVVSEGQPPDEGAPAPDAVLTPRVVSATVSRASTVGSAGTTLISLEWTLSDPEGNAIWITTIQGRGNDSLGLFEGREASTNDQVRMAMEQVMRQTFSDAVASHEIRNFVEARKP
jgi:hypothetical protein